MTWNRSNIKYALEIYSITIIFFLGIQSLFFLYLEELNNLYVV